MDSPYTKADYQIGIICALALEAAAMIAMLDKEHLKLPTEATDPSQYTFGQIGAHNVVIACLSAGSMGNGPAAIVANNMQRSFPIKFGLMVGIGGGVWSTKNDVHLGDVVVSQPTDGHGGVIQWDYGKTESQGEFRCTGHLNKPPPVLLQALQAVHTLDITDGIDILGTLEIMKKNKPRMVKTYKYQGADNDNLFQSTYEHGGGDTCAACKSAFIQDRDSREDLTPQVFYGNIASGNQVMKHGITRDQIAKREKVLCFEMEAAGLMDNFPCLVIRGICDYADSHKNKDWQPYAAATAAVFARILLGFVNPQGVKDTPSM
jgi:nucleoside phosphorylase